MTKDARARSGFGNNAARKAIVVGGTAILLLSFGYLYLSVRENWSSVVDQNFSQITASWMVFGAATYGLSVLTTSLAWPAILSALDTPLTRRSGIGIGLTAQVGKYLPGNVLHYFGRAALAARHSISLTQSGVSTVVELGAAPIAAGLFVLISIVIEPASFGILSQHFLPQGYNPARFVFVSLAVGGGMLLVVMSRVSVLAPYMSWRLWGRPVAALLCSFTLGGFSFFCVIEAFNSDTDMAFVSVGAVYSVAWLLGFLVPGAPAGLGVREATLVAFLSGILGPGPAILCALTHRVVSMVMDGAMAVVGAAIMTGVEATHE